MKIEPATVTIDGVRFEVPRDALRLEPIPGAELAVTVTAYRPDHAAALKALQQGGSVVYATCAGMTGYDPFDVTLDPAELVAPLHVTMEHGRTRVAMWLRQGKKR